MENTTVKLEYVWIDGCKPWGMRSKVKIMSISGESIMRLSAGDYRVPPQWGFDGSSTEQATGADSDCLLDPVCVIRDPLEANDFIILCEVLNGAGTPHSSNRRVALEEIVSLTEDHEPWFGLEQEYTIVREKGWPIGFPVGGYPEPQGKYYCSAGGDRAYGRQICDLHAQACINSGISITGTNAEVCPGQWEFQVGGPGIGPLEVSDQLWLARWLLLKISESFNLTISFEPKPVKGDWNGAGCHTNYSTKAMRKEGGITAIEAACRAIGENIQKHLDAYGADIESRLTGDHETCSYLDFKWGIADRTASIRIPRPVANEGRGYLEDRRPNANCNPYEVCRVLLETTCLNQDV